MSCRYFILVFFILVHTMALAQQSNEYEDANTAYEQGKIDETYIFLKKSLSNNPDHLPSKILMAEVLALSGYFTDARMEFEESLQAGADPNLVIQSYARVLTLLRDYNAILDLDSSFLTPNNQGFLYAAQALAKLRQNDTDGAEKFYDKAAAVAPNSAVVVTSRIRFYLDQKELETAKKILDKAVVEQSEVAEVYQLLGRYYAINNDVNKQITALENALNIASDHPGILRDLVTAYTSIREYKKAKNAIENTLEDSPEDPMAQFLLSWVSAELGESELSKTTLETLINNLSLIDSDELDERDGILLVSAMANFAARNFEVSRGQFEKYLSRNPENMNAALLLVDVYTNEGNYISAANTFEKYREQIKQDPELTFRLCKLYISANQNHKCNQLLRETKDKFENSEAYLQAESMLYAARGKLDLAINSLEKLPEGNFGALIQKAQISIRANNLNEAQNYVNQLLVAAPNNNDFLNLKASILRKQNKAKEAIDIYQRIVTNNPEHFAASFNLASTYFFTNQLSVANVLTSELLTKKPLNPDLLLLQGKILTRLGETERALKALQTAKTLERNDNLIDSALIDLYLAKNEPEKALSQINILLKNDIINVRLLRIRASIQQELGNTKEAIQDLRMIFGVISNNSDALFELAQLQKAYGDNEGALRSLQRANEIKPEDFFINRNLAQVAMTAQNKQVQETAIKWLNKHHSQEADVMLLNAQAALASNKREKAADYFFNAASQNAFLGPALIGTYQLAMQGINTENFERLFATLAQDPQQNVFAVHLYGDYLYSNKQYEEAKNSYISISNATNYVALSVVLNNLANIYVLEGKIDVARNFSEQSFDIQPNNANILGTLGWIYTLLNKYEEGLDLLRKAYAMNTQDPNLRYNLAFTLHKLGRNDESKRELKVILEGYDDFDKKPEAMALMNTLTAA